MAVAEAVLRLDASGVPGEAAKAATAIRDVERAHQEAAAAARAQEAALVEMAASVNRAIDATERLESMAASTDAERAAIAYQRQAAAIDELARASGRADLAQRAMNNLNAQAAQRLTVSTAATQKLTATQMAHTATMGQAAVSTGQLRAGLVSLGQQAQDVGIQLAMGANPLMILVQQGGQIATAVQQAGGLSATFAAMAPVVTALAPVVAGLAASFILFAAPLALANHELDKMTEKADKAAAAAQRLADSRKSWTDQRDEIVLQVRVAAKEITEAEAAYQRASQAYSTARRSTQAILAEAVRAAEGVDPNARTSAPASATFQARKALEEYNAATERGATLAGMLAEKRILEANGTGKAGDAAKAAAKATKEHESAIRSLLRAMEDQERILRAMAEAALALRLSRGEITDDAYQLARSRLAAPDLERLGRQTAQAEADRQSSAGDEWTKLRQALTAQTFATEENTNRMAVAQRAAGIAAIAAGGPGAVMGAVSSAGPWGAIIAALVELVRNFESIGNMFNDFTKSVQDGIRNLPATIADNLGNWLQTGIESASIVPDFIAGLVDALPTILETIAGSTGTLVAALVDALIVQMPQVVVAFLVALLNPATWIEAGKAFVEGLFSSLRDSNAMGATGSAFGGMFWSSTAKETAKQMASGASKSRTSSGTTVNFYGSVVGVGPDTAQALSDSVATTMRRRRPA